MYNKIHIVQRVFFWIRFSQQTKEKPAYGAHTGFCKGFMKRR